MNYRSQLRKSIVEMLENDNRDGIIAIFTDNSCNIDLRGLEIHDLDLSNLNFFKVINNGSVWSHIRLSNLKFSTSDFRGVLFRDTIFENVIFEDSSFIGAKFINSKFKNVQFISCDLSGAKFDESVTNDIEFKFCNLYNTGLKGEKYLDKLKSTNIADYIYSFILRLVNINVSILPKIMYLFARTLLNNDIPLHSIKLGKNCRFAHLGFGTIITGGCQIGNNVWIGPKVNIFGRYGNFPVIGNNVIIGIGSSIAANVGDNAIIGAGSLVFDDVPDNSLVIGEKAKIKF